MHSSSSGTLTADKALEADIRSLEHISAPGDSCLDVLHFCKACTQSVYLLFDLLATNAIVQ